MFITGFISQWTDNFPNQPADDVHETFHRQ